MMKTFCLLIFVFMLSIGCNAQIKVPYQIIESFETVFNRQDTKRKELWKSKDFRKAIVVMQDLHSRYQQLDSLEKVKYIGNIQGLFYNLSCAYSLIYQIDSSIMYLQNTVDLGPSNYNWLKKDPDLDNIRKDKRYQAIVDKLKETYDYEFILKRNGSYKKESGFLPSVNYQAKGASELTALRIKYHLDAIAGNGSEVSRFINLMSWVHQTVRHDGNSSNPSDRHADAMIELCKKENRGVNCRMLATILNEVYLSMGYQSHFVTCLPKDKNDNDCHVINSVFSHELNKWLWMDPSFDTWVKDDKGNFLGIEEVRKRLVDHLPVFASPKIDHNGTPYGGGGDEYLHSYMAKNLFQVQIPSISCSAFESRTSMESLVLQNPKPMEKFYIQLIPSEFKHENVALGKIVNGVYYTNDSEQFWKKP